MPKRTAGKTIKPDTQQIRIELTAVTVTRKSSQLRELAEKQERGENIEDEVNQVNADFTRNRDRIVQKRLEEVKQQQPVILKGKGRSCVVLGKQKPKLTDARYDVVRTLLGYPKGMTKDALASASGHISAVNILKGLSRIDDDWRQVISLAGTTGGKYRIVWPD